MIDTGYLFSKDTKRIFVNTCLGCTGKCSYCYLSQMGYDNKAVVSNIKTAEAVKVIENSQRDINIAFMNEIAIICDKLNIDTIEVLDIEKIIRVLCF